MQRVKEIKQIYKIHEKILISNAIWKETITYPSEFYTIEFKTAKELIGKITIMIEDTIKCFKRQNWFTRIMTENLLIDLQSINRKLMYIYTFA